MSLINNFKKISLQDSIFYVFMFYAVIQCISLAVANIALAVMAVCSVIYICRHRNEVFENFKKNKVFFYFLLGLAVCLLLSALASGDPIHGFRVWIEKYVYRLSPLVVIVLILPKREYVLPLIWGSIFSCFITTIGGFIKGPEYHWRIQGIYGHPMTLAGFLCVSLPFLFEQLFEKDKRIFIHILKVLAFVGLTIGLLFNGTRGAWLAVGLSWIILSVVFLIKSKKNFLIIGTVVVITAVSFLSSDNFTRRAASVTSTTFQSNTERLLMWQSAFDMFKDHPLLGVGLGQYGKQYQTKYIKPEAKERHQVHAHSNVFHTLGESGLVGLIGFLSFFGYVFWLSFRRYWTTKNIYAITLFAFSIAIFFQGLTEYNFGSAAVIKYYWLFLGSFLILSQTPRLQSR